MAKEIEGFNDWLNDPKTVIPKCSLLQGGEFSNEWKLNYYKGILAQRAVEKFIEDIYQSLQVSDDFITFCQTGKYPEQKEETDDEVKAENRYVYNLKDQLRRVLNKSDCSEICTLDGCPCDCLDVYALLELAAEISPTETFFEEAFIEVSGMYESDPERVINNLPR